MFSLQLDSKGLGQVQEEMLAAYSNLLNALNEVTQKQEYLSGIWKGKAAENFAGSQKHCFLQMEECVKGMEGLIASFQQIEAVFGQYEKKVSKVIGEKRIWEI